jgi:hypothetical protein
MHTTFDRLLAVLKQRRFVQFRLRTVLALMTLACVASAVYGWHYRNGLPLEVMVERYNDCLDNGEFAEAERIAIAAIDRYPQERVTAFMREKVRLIRNLVALDAGELVVDCGTFPRRTECYSAERQCYSGCDLDLDTLTRP